MIKKVSTGSFFGDDEAQEKGFVRAVISTFDIVDRDNDVITASAIKDGTEVIMASWGHKWGELPIGKGVLKVSGNQAVFEGNFFLHTTAGRETYETVKALANSQEWSWGFSILPGGSEIKRVDGKEIRYIHAVEPYEVSPVLVGANPQTGTLDIKSASMEEETEKSDDELLETLVEKECIDSLECTCENESCIEKRTQEEVVEKQEDMMEEDPEDVAEDTTLIDLTAQAIDALKQIVVVLINDDSPDFYKIQWVVDAISVLSYIRNDELWDVALDTMGSLKTSDQKKDNIIKSYSTLLHEVITEKFGDTIEEEKEKKSLKYAEQGERLLEEVVQYGNRSRSLADLRAKEGRELSESNRKRLASLLDALKTATSDIEDLLTSTQIVVNEEQKIAEPEPESSEKEITEEVVVTADQRFKNLDRRLKLADRKQKGFINE